MKKTIIVMLMAIIAIGIGHAQLPSSFPPKSYPASIMFVSDPGVKQYREVTRITYLGEDSGIHNFVIEGIGRMHDMGRSIEIYYICNDMTLDPLGFYYFEEINSGEAFSKEISTYPYTPAPETFLGFLFREERISNRDEIPELPEFVNLNQ